MRRSSSKRPTRPLIPPPLDVVPLGIRCAQCGYFLVNLRWEGNCPECGTPAGQSRVQSLAVVPDGVRRWFAVFVTASLALTLARLIFVVLLSLAAVGTPWPAAAMLFPPALLVVGGVTGAVVTVQLWGSGERRVRRVLTGNFPVGLLVGQSLEASAGTILLMQVYFWQTIELNLLILAGLILTLGTACQWRRSDVLSSLAIMTLQPRLGEQARSLTIRRTVLEVSMVGILPVAAALTEAGAVFALLAGLLLWGAVLVYGHTLCVEVIQMTQLGWSVARVRRASLSERSRILPAEAGEAGADQRTISTPAAPGRRGRRGSV